MEGLDTLFRRTFYRIGVSGNCVSAAGLLIIIYFYPENEALKIAPLTLLKPE